MRTVPLSEAKDKLSALVEEAGVGDAFHSEARAGEAAGEEGIEGAMMAAEGDPCALDWIAEEGGGAGAES